MLLRKIINKLRQRRMQQGVVAKSYMKDYLPANPVVVEAGAHIGSDTIELATKWKGSKVFAFEPVPEIYRQLVRNTKRFRNVVTVPLALSDRQGEAEIHVSGGLSDGSSSLLEPK